MRLTRRSAALVLVLVLAAAPALADAFRIIPHVENVTTDGATLIWETRDEAKAIVTYGLEGQNEAGSIRSESSAIHRARITWLKPDTAYWYRIEADGAVFENGFTTAPGEPRDTTFVVIGDSRRWDDRFEKTEMAAHLLEWDPEFFLNMGDLVGSGHEYDQWPEHFDRFADILPRYMMVTARGNHEGSMLKDTENDWFAKYHELPGDGEPYAAFDWGNTHLVLLSFEQLVGRAQAETVAWLDNHLAQVDAQYVIVSQHYPVYCTGYYSEDDSRKEVGKVMRPIADVLDKHDVDVHLSGHTHIYERCFPIRGGERVERDGVLYVVQGGDIGANYPEWWTALKDDEATMDKPTYTVFQCKSDRLEMRTFCWSREQERIIEIDRLVLWEDEALPSGIVASLPGLEGNELATALEELAAMAYRPAGRAAMAHVADKDVAVRRAAAHAVAASGDAAVAMELLPFLDDGDLEIQRTVAEALASAMPSDAAKTVAQAVADSKRDPIMRQSLITAFDRHAPKRLACKTLLDVVRQPGDNEVRRRAAYALVHVAEKRNVKEIARLLNAEQDRFVLLRLAFTLSEVTGKRQGVSGRRALPESEPGERDEFIKPWLDAAKKK